MKIPAIQSQKAATALALLYPILLEIALYFNVIWYVQIFNILLLFIVYALVLVLCRRICPALIAITVLMLGLSIANEFSINARSVAFQISDFFCLADAMRLSGRYSFEVTSVMVRDTIFSTILLSTALCLLRDYDDKPYKHTTFKRSAALFCTALPAALFLNLEDHSDGDIKFDINRFTKENGVLYSLYVEAKQHDIEEPVGYCKDTAETVLQTQPVVQQHKRPNIIVVMNESLADYDLVGEMPLTQDILPYLHSMEENCIKGKVLVSVFGGYTCQSEWEFLTGNSMAFLPVTAVPYNQCIEQPIDSIAASLKKMGYATTAVHPYHGIEWNRDVNYPLMGFDRFVTGEEFGEVTEEMLETLPADMEESLYFGDLDYIRGFVSDSENYRKVMEVMEEKPAGVPQFIFNVTIQNHGSYGYEGEDFEALELCEGASEEVNQYLTVAHESDKAFAELITYFENYPEDTIILLFGDHQPALDMPYTSLFADPDNPVAVREANYTLPYVMWANYDVDWETQDITSLNYLSAILKENAGLPLDSWDTFRLGLMEEYPALNSYGAVDAQGNFCQLREVVDTSAQVQEYQRLQHYRMFDDVTQTE